jgi:hypothetical protein
VCTHCCWVAPKKKKKKNGEKQHLSTRNHFLLTRPR